MSQERGTQPLSRDHYARTYAEALAPLARGLVLDVGCGEGWVTTFVADRPEVRGVVGTDKFDGPQRIHPKVAYVRIRTEALIAQPPDTQFDTVLCTEHVEHLDAPLHRPLLAWIRDALTPGGVFLGSMPDQEAPAGPYHRKEYYGWHWERILRDFFPEVRLWNVQSSCYVWAASLAPAAQQRASHKDAPQARKGVPEALQKDENNA